MFQNIYTAQGDGMIAFGSSFPGRIAVLKIAPGKEMVVQKSAFLAPHLLPGAQAADYDGKCAAFQFIRHLLYPPGSFDFNPHAQQGLPRPAIFRRLFFVHHSGIKNAGQSVLPEWTLFRLERTPASIDKTRGE